MSEQGDLKKVKRVKKRVFYLLGGLLLISLIAICVKTIFLKEKAETYKDINYLHKLTMDCIEVEETKKIMNTDKQGEATLVVKMPDFKKIFNEASKEVDSENAMEEYVEKTLVNKKYTIIERKITADIFIEGGEEIIYSEEAVKKLLGEELINAMNTVMEGE